MDSSESKLKFSNLSELFWWSLHQEDLDGRICVEIVRGERQETLTFGQLRRRAKSFGLWLRQRGGLRVGEKAAIIGKNRADWDVAFWGIVLAGGVPVLIDPERSIEGVIEHLRHTDSRFVVMADDWQQEQSQRELAAFARSSGIGFVEMGQVPLGEDLLAEQAADGNGGRRLDAWPGLRIGADETAVILCTSGTTGDPREVELTGRNLIANLEGSVEKVDIHSGDVLGHILPPHHSFGLTVGKLLPLWVGATNVYTNRYRYVGEIIRDYGVTIFVAVPALFSMLAKRMEERLAAEKRRKWWLAILDRCVPELVGRMMMRKQGWERVRFFLSGSAAMPRWVLEFFWRHGIRLYEGYGTTENSPVYGFNDDRRKLGSVGRPIRTLFVRIVDEDGRILPAFARGEIVLGGPCIMKGYYKNPKATQAVVWTDEVGVRWLRTGDLGYLDEQGNLFITGRKKYVIVLPGGKNVNPELVESALSEARFVAEVLVVPHRRTDPAGIEQETVKAIVRPDWETLEAHTRLCAEELKNRPEVIRKLVWQSIRQCQQRSRHLAPFERISSRDLEIRIEEFQKTPTGKIKRELYMPVECRQASEPVRRM